MTIQFVSITPPVYMMEALRNLGYSMDSAVADIVDNSITAQATDVDISFSWGDGQPWLAIVDNGVGILDCELNTVMTPASKNPLDRRDAKDLGRFGMGLKTASFSQCRCLTVLSKTKGGEWSGREFNLDDMVQSELWQVRVLSPKNIDDLFQNNTGLKRGNPSGTLVLWTLMDRVSGQSENEMNRQISVARDHLGLVFHRFIKPDPGFKAIKIRCNNAPIEAFDPFNASNFATTCQTEERAEIEGQSIVVTPYILPHHAKVSSTEYEKYEGKAGYLKNQGFYVYRNRRLIINGDWFRLKKQENRTNLVRIKVDIPSSLDHVWLINVMKSSAQPPEVIRKVLRRVLPKVSEAGGRVYTARGRKSVEKNDISPWIRRESSGKISYEINRDHPLLQELMDTEIVLTKAHLQAFIGLVESRLPIDALFNDVSSSPQNMNQPEVCDENFIHLVKTYADMFQTVGKTPQEVREAFTLLKPFNEHMSQIDQILNAQNKGNNA
jgi:hypothetical protein